MNSSEIITRILDGAVSLRGKKLPYLSRNNFFIPDAVDAGRIQGRRSEGEIALSANMIETYAKALESGNPIHVDTALGGAGNERSALEALVTHLPNAGSIPRGEFNGKRGKHVVWLDTEINTLGEVRDVTGDWQSLRGHVEKSGGIPTSKLCASLLAKPFLILTGPSGTGKTRAAIEMAEELCEIDCRAVVAVGADWTDNRHVLGFLNPLQTDGGSTPGIPIYETTPILDLLLHANAPENRHTPHVLILDEMNLSHVERYFADFLSAMELKDKEGALKLHSAGLAKTREGIDVPGSIDFPENLFVIGTVNIDETTYMFSPKVLDRANVIEIHAEEEALGAVLRGTSVSEESEERDYGISFLDAARVIRDEDEHEHVPLLPESVRTAAADRLLELFGIMQRGRGEFGFRTGREVMAYLRTVYFLTAEAEREEWATENGGWLDALDTQVLQKILPKLHGSRTRIAPLLGALATYCATAEKSLAMEHFPEGGSPAKRGLGDARNHPEPKFKKSYWKLERMIEVLIEEQFVSFIC